jgi:hypothetical protein
LFAPSSFWNVPIPASAPLHANQAAMLADFVAQTKLAAPAVSKDSWCATVYTVGPDVPKVKVAITAGHYQDKGLAEQWAAVPIPDYAVPGPDGDAEMVIYQPSTGTWWEFYHFARVNGQCQAVWGGRISSTGNGIFPNPYGACSTGIPLNQITPEELAAGAINHVIAIGIPHPAPGFVWPANRNSDATAKLTGTIPHGTRFRLDPAANVDALHPVAKTIARAMQKYGAVTCDCSGAVAMRCVNSRSYASDPYAALFGSTAYYSILKGFPWDRVQFMPANYGR